MIDPAIVAGLADDIGHARRLIDNGKPADAATRLALLENQIRNLAEALSPEVKR